MWSFLVKSVIVISAFSIGTANQLKKLQRNHTPQRLTNGEIRQLAGLSNINYFNEAIDNILIPRVVGTPGHEKVFNYITSELDKLGWTVEVDEFQDVAPKFGRLLFKNIVGVLNPDAERFLVLACHYDSKYFQNEVFVGAIDSAVPCAMMLNLAKVLKPQLESIKSNSDLSLKLIFFDGEEAFESWGPRDSIYGARHLAAKYHKSRSDVKSTGESVSELQKIDLLILLDLIGHKDANFYNYFGETSRWFNRMADAEDKLDSLGLMRPRNTKYFIRRDFFSGNIEDDHLPFLKRNVPVLHLIPIPFPKEWHTPRDNRDIIDVDAVENINKILRIFVAEYLHVYLSTGIAFRQIAFTFRISKSSVASIVMEVCKAIWDSLQKTHMPLPTVSDFENVAVQYFNKWNFPNCLGNIDGKHIRVKCPAKTGSMFYNYKNYFSIVLMTIVDANYRFLMIVVGAYGKYSDSGVFSNSAIYQNIDHGSLVLPIDKQLPNFEQKTPLVFIGDEAFPLRTYLLRPYPRRRLHNNEAASYYNYRLSRARMSVECAFGISSSKFRILLKFIETKVENAVRIVKAICILHNAMIDMEGDPLVNGLQGSTDNNHSDNNHNLRISRSHSRPTREAENLRDTL